MSQNDRSKSPFSELSFSQQQEQWRMFRAQQLDFQAVESKKPPRAPQRPAETVERRRAACRGVSANIYGISSRRLSCSVVTPSAS